MSDLIKEISRRRTFAIISHPDAGKTTLTEKFLLYGGAIAQAGDNQLVAFFINCTKNIIIDNLFDPHFRAHPIFA